MASEEAEVAAAAPQAVRAGMGRTLGMAAGLFVLVVLAQFVTGIVGCQLFPGLMPGCSSGELPAADGKPAKKAPKAPPIYQAFDPPLVVSFQEQGSMRFLQVTVEVMGREEAAIKAVETHMPVIRNNLLNIFAGHGFADLISREGKEAMRKECLAEVQRILSENFGKPGVEDLYFTSFVVQ